MTMCSFQPIEKKEASRVAFLILLPPAIQVYPSLESSRPPLKDINDQSQMEGKPLASLTTLCNGEKVGDQGDVRITTPQSDNLRLNLRELKGHRSACHSQGWAGTRRVVRQYSGRDQTRGRSDLTSKVSELLPCLDRHLAFQKREQIIEGRLIIY